jgi:hypothetical protein
MANRWIVLLLWAPRLIGIAVCLFLSLFALDAFTGSKPALEAAGEFLVHVSPVLFLLVVVALSWRWEWVGGLVFTGIAVAYAYLARDHAAWIATISGPLLLVGLLFLVSWSQHRRLRGAQ